VEMADGSEPSGAAATAEWLRAQRAENAANALRRRRAATEEEKPIVSTAPGWGVEAILADPEGLRLFRRFCEANYAEENLRFLLEAREWRAAWATQEEAERSAEAKRLRDTYLVEGAPMQVSLPSGCGAFEVVEPRMFERACMEARKSLILGQLPDFELTAQAKPLKARLAAERAVAKEAAAKEAEAAKAAREAEAMATMLVASRAAKLADNTQAADATTADEGCKQQ
jgi:hypothetical protein